MVPNALLNEGLEVMEAWGFKYKSNLIWHKVRKDGGQMAVELDFTSATQQKLYFWNQVILRTLQPGSNSSKYNSYPKTGAFKKNLMNNMNSIQNCSPGPYLELFARA